MLPLVVVLGGIVVTALFGRLRPRWSGPLAVVTCAAAAGTLLAAWRGGGGSAAVPWVPAWGVFLAWRLDGVAALYGLVTAGIGTVVSAYAVPYIKRHLEHEHRDPREQVRFHLMFLLFVASMLGLVLSDDLLLLFVFWDLTAVASFLLIGFDRGRKDARRAAYTAILVTGGTSVLMLAAVLAIGSRFGTFRISTIEGLAEVGAADALAVTLIVVAALAKSAQLPLHFWLPPAMTAPTPVSAYLHSAAMVAAGVFLVQRLHPLISATPALPTVLVVVGVASTVVGGLLALTRREMKKLLAYSTIAQYGQVTFLLGLGTPLAVGAAGFYVVAHALAKSALFLAAGAVTDATGQKAFHRLGGMAASMPVLAAATAVACAGLAGLPLTVGFFKDELLFRAAIEQGAWTTAGALAGPALTLAYIWRFWSGIFLGRRAVEPHHAAWSLQAPVVLLGALTIAWGVHGATPATLAEASAAPAIGRVAPLETGYHLDLRGTNLAALSAWAIAAGLLVTGAGQSWSRVLAAAARRVGPAAIARGSLQAVAEAAVWVRRLAPVDLPARIAFVLVAAGILGGVSQLPFSSMPYEAGRIELQRMPLLAGLVAVGCSAVAAAAARRPVVVVAALGFPSLAAAVVFTAMGAPDVALVAVLVGVLLTVLLVAGFGILPREELDRRAEEPATQRWRSFQLLTAVVSASATFLVVLALLSMSPSGPSVAARHLQLAEAAHARNVVTAILTDFRGLDTIGEITVLAIAALGVRALWRR